MNLHNMQNDIGNKRRRKPTTLIIELKCETKSSARNNLSCIMHLLKKEHKIKSNRINVRYE